VDSDHSERESKRGPVERATEELVRAAEFEATKIRAGLIDPKFFAYATN
jgi:hypothetical protein